MQELCDLRIVGDAEPDDGQQPEFGVEFGGFEPLRFMQQRVDLFDEVGVDREENSLKKALYSRSVEEGERSSRRRRSSPCVLKVLKSWTRKRSSLLI